MLSKKHETNQIDLGQLRDAFINTTDKSWWLKTTTYYTYQKNNLL